MAAICPDGCISIGRKGDSYQRRTLSAALCEARVRREGVRRLDIHGVRAWRCIAKPLAVALVPDGLHARIKRRWYAYNRFQTYWKSAGELRPFHVSGDALTQCAAHVVAPVVTAYVAWVLRQALHHGHTRLYFCARDGWLPYHCACLLIKRWQLPVECRYLYVSRAALRQPCYHMDVDRALEWICRDAMQVTLAVLLVRSGIPRSKWQRLITELATAVWDGGTAVACTAADGAAGIFPLCQCSRRTAARIPCPLCADKGVSAPGRADGWRGLGDRGQRLEWFAGPCFVARAERWDG